MIHLFTNEKKLIQKAAAGDRKAQQHLFEKHAPKMLSICRQYLSPIQLAEEVMLNGFFKAFTKLDTFNYQGSFEGWLRRIIVHSCLDQLRKKDPFKFSSQVDEGTVVTLDAADQDNDNAITMDVLQECIDALPDGYRTIFIMYAIDGFKHKEIAQHLSISENTSKTQFRKARMQLQEHIGKIKKVRYEA